MNNLAAVLSIAFMSATANAQLLLNVDVTDPRPLVQALDQIEPNLRVPINFEEVRMENKSDIVDVQTLMTPADIASSPGYHLRVSRGGHLKASLHLSSDESMAEASIAVGALLAAYGAGNMPGEYGMEESGDSIYVLPQKVLSESGQLKDADSPLSRNLKVAAVTVSFDDGLQILAQSLSQATGFKVKIITPFPMPQNIQLAANGEPGRVVLSRMMDQLKLMRLSYRLMYDLQELAYYLRFELVPQSPVPQIQETPSLVAPSISSGVFWTRPT